MNPLLGTRLGYGVRHKYVRRSVRFDGFGVSGCLVAKLGVFGHYPDRGRFGDATDAQYVEISGKNRDTSNLTEKVTYSFGWFKNKYSA